MTRAIVRFGVFLIVLCVAAPGFAASFSSTTSGNWSSASTWGGAGVPGSGDTATVNGGHVVTLDIPVTVAGGSIVNGGFVASATTLATSTTVVGGTMLAGGTTFAAGTALAAGTVVF